MTTLRERVRHALGAHEPKADLDGVLRLTDARRLRARRIRTFVPALAAAAAFVGLFFATRPKPAPVAALPAPSPHGVHVYIRVDGEPESRALDLAFDLKGDL